MSKAKLKIIKTPKKRVKRPSSLPMVMEKKDKTLSLADPNAVMGFGKILKSFITDNNLSVKIGDTDYSKVDGWKYAGLNFGLTAVPSKPVPKHKGGEYIIILYAMVDRYTKERKKYQKEVPVFVGFAHDREIIEEVRLRNKITRELTKPYFAYECDCEIIKLSDNTRVTRGTGFCSNLELLKSEFDEYSVISMSETRSIGKGYRNLIGYVMNAAGMSDTPAEEMTQDMKHEEVSDLPGLSDAQFKAALAKVMSGEMTIEKIKEHSSLTQAQETALEIAVKNKQGL